MKRILLIFAVLSLTACTLPMFGGGDGNVVNEKVDTLNTGTESVNVGDVLDENSDLNLSEEVLTEVACLNNDEEMGVLVCRIPLDTTQQVETLCITLTDLAALLGQGVQTAWREPVCLEKMRRHRRHHRHHHDDDSSSSDDDSSSSDDDSHSHDDDSSSSDDDSSDGHHNDHCDDDPEPDNAIYRLGDCEDLF